MAHPPRIPVWLRSDQSVVYFVTICVANRKAVLANERAFHAFRNAVARLQHWRVIAAVLMPDHLHAIVAPNDREFRVGNFSAALKRWMRKELEASWSWQPGSFDRLLRSGDSLEGKRRYLQDNPVRAGVVKHWSDWPYRIGLDEE
jgi:REP-associated tyrosine transposase